MSREENCPHPGTDINFRKKKEISLAFCAGLCYDARCVYRRSSMEKEVKIQ